MNIMIVGVGGQGTLLASRIIGAAAINLGVDVKLSEVHGMSQRGGSVVTYVRYGESVASPEQEEDAAKEEATEDTPADAAAENEETDNSASDEEAAE